MGIAARMFNRRASRDKSMPDRVVESLGIGQGEWVADIGSGGGYYSFRFSTLVGEAGRVFAVDTNPRLLSSVADQANAEGLVNLETILADGFPSQLPSGKLDLVFMRNVYHHLVDPEEYMRRMRRHLGPGGRVAILDYTDSARGFSFHRMFGHHVPPQRIEEDMRSAGYEVERSFEFLPEQSFTIFRPG